MPQTNNKSSWILGAGLFVLLTGAFLAFDHFTKGHEVVTKDFERREAAIDFSLPVISTSHSIPGVTDQLRLTALRGKPVLIHFWASWCSVCREEKPFLDEFWEKHHDGDIAVIGVASFDTAQAMQASELIKEQKFTVALDEDGAIANKYKIPALPVTVLIDADGFIVQRYKGALKKYDFNAIETYLSTLAPAAKKS